MNKSLIFQKTHLSKQTRKQDGFELSLGRLAFDIASLKRINAPIEDIGDLESIWRDTLRKYKRYLTIRQNKKSAHS